MSISAVCCWAKASIGNRQAKISRQRTNGLNIFPSRTAPERHLSKQDEPARLIPRTPLSVGGFRGPSARYDDTVAELFRLDGEDRLHQAHEGRAVVEAEMAAHAQRIQRWIGNHDLARVVAIEF